MKVFFGIFQGFPQKLISQLHRDNWNLTHLKTSTKSFLNYKIRIYKRFIIRLWMLLIPLIVIAHLSRKPKRVVTGKSADLSLLKGVSYEDKYTSKMLSAVPISDRPLNSKVDSVFSMGCRNVTLESQKARANAAFVVLCRNSELEGVISSMRSMERHFNQWFNYPWIFLNNEKFTKEFKSTVMQISSGSVKFGFIPRKKWDFPDEEKEATYFNEGIEAQGDRGILYGNMPSYHKMCRFYSGFFYKHPLVKSLDWYWRVEPDVQFYCDLTYDPFIEMEKNNKHYGFNVAIKELINTVPSLYRYTRAFIRNEGIEVKDSMKFFINDLKFYKGVNSAHYKSVKNKEELFTKLQERIPMMRALSIAENAKNNLMYSMRKSKKSILDKIDQNSIDKLVGHSNKRGLPLANKNEFDSTEFNLCHFWSNFEIARTDLFTSLPYQQYFEYLESSKGFYTERWGDAPIHSLAVGMFLNLSNVHYFRDIGYEHSTLKHCPYNAPKESQLTYRKSDKYKNLYVPHDEKYWLDIDPPNTQPDVGVGCRCRCPDDLKDVENSSGTCMAVWASLVDDERSQDSYLDVDTIEEKLLRKYDEYLSNNDGDGAGWYISKEEILELEKNVVY